MVQPVGIEPTSIPLQGTAITISAKVACCWRKAEESNPIPVKRTWFSRPVAGPSPLHYFPLSGVGDRNRTCIILICNQVPGRSAHTHTIGLGSRNRTYAPWSQTKSDTISPYRENLVPRWRIELPYAPCKDAVLPLNYRGKIRMGFAPNGP